MCHFGIIVAFRIWMDHLQARRVGVFQKGLQNNGKVFPEETIAVQQLLQSFLERSDMIMHSSDICLTCVVSNCKQTTITCAKIMNMALLRTQK